MKIKRMKSLYKKLISWNILSNFIVKSWLIVSILLCLLFSWINNIIIFVFSHHQAILDKKFGVSSRLSIWLILFLFVIIKVLDGEFEIVRAIFDLLFLVILREIYFGVIEFKLINNWIDVFGEPNTDLPSRIKWIIIKPHSSSVFSHGLI